MILQPDRYLLKRQIKRYAHFIKGTVLDAGSSEGERYKSFFNFEKYITLDVDPNCNPDILGSIESIPLNDNSVDAIICTQVLEHVKKPQKAVEEFFRILKPGGYCLVTVPQWSELHDEPNDYFRFTNFALEEIFKTAGLKIILFDRRGGFWTCKSQIKIRYVIDFFNLNQRPIFQKLFKPYGWVLTKISDILDSIDKSRANAKQAIGWLVIGQKQQ